MKYFFILFLATLAISSCSSGSLKNINSKRCEKIYHNDFAWVLQDTFKSIVNSDTVFINEIKFECVHSSFYIQKAMYDRFGRWNKSIKPLQRSTILIWEKVTLFENDTIQFTVAGMGEENYQTIYASVMVFDQNNQDMLAINSPYRERLINYFSKAIRNDNIQKRSFYEVYWKTFDPERWEEIQKYNKARNN